MIDVCLMMSSAMEKLIAQMNLMKVTVPAILIPIQTPLILKNVVRRNFVVRRLLNNVSSKNTFVTANPIV